MKTFKIFWIILVLFTFLFCDVGDNNSNAQTSVIAKYGEPQEYFPMEIGTKWKYDIKLTENKKTRPLCYEVVSWPVGGKYISYATRGILYPGKDTDDIQLILRVDSLAKKQGSLKYPIGVKVGILRDDLGIYRDNVGLFWAGVSSGRFQITKVALHDPMSSSAPRSGGWGGWGGKPGESMNLKFFGSRPMIAISIGDNSPDRLLFVGPEDFAGSTALHFRRIVDKTDRSDDKGLKKLDVNYLDKSFTEDMWYLRHVGLVRLVQTVDGVETMVWTLKGY